jgi:hypothetical protein
VNSSIPSSLPILKDHRAALCFVRSIISRYIPLGERRWFAPCLHRYRFHLHRQVLGQTRPTLPTHCQWFFRYLPNIKYSHVGTVSQSVLGFDY